MPQWLDDVDFGVVVVWIITCAIIVSLVYSFQLLASIYAPIWDFDQNGIFTLNDLSEYILANACAPTHFALAVLPADVRLSFKLQNATPLTPLTAVCGALVWLGFLLGCGFAANAIDAAQGRARQKRHEGNR